MLRKKWAYIKQLNYWKTNSRIIKLTELLKNNDKKLSFTGI